LHDIVAVPEPLRLAGVIGPHVRPVGNVSLRLTNPVNPFRGDIAIVELVEVPAFIGAGEEMDIVKSRNRKVTVAL